MIRLVIATLFFCHVLGDPIVGGHNCDIVIHPWLASIQLNGDHYCVGSIISDNVILTAAHCAIELSKNMSASSVRVGSSRSDTGGSLHNIVSIRSHEEYHDTGGAIVLNVNDLALIRVSPSFRMSRRVDKIQLADRSWKVRPGAGVGVAGWGSQRFGGSTQINLRSTVLVIIDSAECAKAYKDKTGTKMSFNNLICAADEGNDSCGGDSGAPLVEGGILVGIVSTGVGCGLKHYPGVYVEISHYRDWIDAHTR